MCTKNAFIALIGWISWAVIFFTARDLTGTLLHDGWLTKTEHVDLVIVFWILFGIATYKTVHRGQRI